MVMKTEEDRFIFVLGIMCLISISAINVLFVVTGRLTIVQVLLADLFCFVVLGLIALTVAWISRGE